MCTVQPVSIRIDLQFGRMSREVWTIELGVGVGPFPLGATIAEALYALKVNVSFATSSFLLCEYKRPTLEC